MRFAKIILGTAIILCLFCCVSVTSCKKSSTTPPPPPPPVDTIDTKTGLIASFDFNGGSLNDNSGNGNNIAFNNAVTTTDRFGKANNAYLFNGTSSYMTVKNSSSLNPSRITMFAIIKVNGYYAGPCGGNQILSKGYPYDVNGFYDMGFFDFASNCGTINTNNESFAAGFGDDIPQGAAAGAGADSVKVKTGQWYYVAYTYDGSTSNFYVNGQLKDSRTKSITFNPNTYDVFIGKHENPPFPYYFNGTIDELRIYNKALSPDVIVELGKLKY